MCPRSVRVRDRLGADDALLVVIEFDFDLVVGALLPVFVAGRTGSGPVDVGSWQPFAELTETIFGEVLRHGG